MRKVSTQEADNAKCYSIFSDVFEYTFLSLNVKWGQVLAKGNKEDNDQNEKIKKIKLRCKVIYDDINKRFKKHQNKTGEQNKTKNKTGKY